MIISQGNNQIKVNNWPLAEDLFIKWGYDTKDVERIEVKNIYDVTSGLSMWGIPWKWNS